MGSWQAADFQWALPVQSDPNTWSQQIPAGFIFASFAQNHRQLIAPALVKKLTISSHSNIGWKRACCIAGPNSIHASGISKVPLAFWNKHTAVTGGVLPCSLVNGSDQNLITRTSMRIGWVIPIYPMAQRVSGVSFSADIQSHPVQHFQRHLPTSAILRRFDFVICSLLRYIFWKVFKNFNLVAQWL